MHEVRWLPTPVDENFTQAATTVRNGGTMFAALCGVDATSTSTTTAVLNGYFEVVIIWEWTPNTSGGVGITVNPQAPLPYTTQQLLSSVGDMGAYLFEGARKAGTGAMRAAGYGAAVAVTRGVQSYMTRGGAFPRVR